MSESLILARHVLLPRSWVLGRILGMMGSGATVKEGKILRLEVSAKDIAERLGISKSTVEAALRWLSCGPITHHGEQIARGLGLIHRGRRTGLVFHDGKLRQVYRTSHSPPWAGYCWASAP